MKTLKITLLLAVVCLFFVSLAPKNGTDKQNETYELENVKYDVIAHRKEKGQAPENA